MKNLLLQHNKSHSHFQNDELYDRIYNAYSHSSERIEQENVLFSIIVNVIIKWTDYALYVFFCSVYLSFSLSLTVSWHHTDDDRSFSILRRIKTYLRTTTGEDRLSVLALLNIDLEFEIDYDKIVKEFVAVSPNPESPYESPESPSQCFNF